MAPPQTSGSVQARLVLLAQTLQFAWFIGHVTLLACTLRYALSVITFNTSGTWAALSYRTAFIAAAATYGIVVYKAYRSRVRQGKGHGSPITLLTDENVEYLMMALIWLFTSQRIVALAPFAVYSVFHVATYTRGVLLPMLFPPPQGAARPSGLSDTIGHFVKNYYDSSMTLVAGLEILLWFDLLRPAIFFQKWSWVMLTAYTVFFRLRVSQSSFVQHLISNITARIDAQVANQSTPPAARNAWTSVKRVIGQAGDATDIMRYIQPAAQPKKAQ